MIRVSSISRAVALLAAGAVLLAASQANAQRILRWKLKKGDKLQYSIVSDMAIEGGFGKFAIKSTADLSVEVGAVDGKGLAEVKLVVDRLQLKSESDMGNTEFDSDKDASQDGENPFAAVVRNVVKKEVPAKMSSRGELTDWTFSDELKKAFEEGQQAAAFIRAPTSEDSFKALFGKALVGLSKNAVAKGDKWEAVEVLAGFGGKVTSTHAFEYTGSEKKDGVSLDALSVTTKQKTEADPNAQFKSEVKEFDSTGTVYFDAAKGRVKSREHKTSSKSTNTFMGNTSDATATETLTIALKE